jgi:hypothetical protein
MHRVGLFLKGHDLIHAADPTAFSKITAQAKLAALRQGTTSVVPQSPY